MTKRSPYPLQWPSNTPRTKPIDRQRSAFHTRVKRDDGRSEYRPLSVYEAAKGLVAELVLLEASSVAITSMLPTRHDGLPYSDGRSEDPGITVWCVYNGRERAFACDQWQTPAENLRAISLSIAALRGLTRWGMADIAERAFAGFAALPSGEPEPERRPPWREVFAINGNMADLSGEDLLAIVKARHRKAITETHPDVGGDTARAAALNVALDEATAELSQERR